jgi:hypothetical protein
MNLPGLVDRFHPKSALLPSSPNSTMLISLRRRFVAALALCAPLTLGAQVIDLTVHDVGVAIGDKPRMTGLRINFRDRELREVNGVNVTIWSPYSPAEGVVNGLAVGVPVTGARDINGIGAGLFGVGVDNRLRGIAVGGIGVGAGQELRGIALGGVGVGSGGSVIGLTVGGIGVGSGGSVRGVQIGGIGVGSGGDVTGISVAGIGVGSGGRTTGLAIAGIGVGGGGSFRGIGIAGIGVGAGGDATGLMLGGVGVGAGGRLRGVGIGGVGVGAPKLEGLMIGGLGVGGADVHAIALTAGYFKIADDGNFRGGALGAVTRVGGTQHGLTIGLFNYARELHGTQIGIINVSDNGGHRRVIPLVSVR